MKLTLASGSEHRARLLELAGVEYDVRVPNIDETTVTGKRLPPAEVARSIAAQKAITVWNNHDGEIILGADTIVALDGEILGHPKDEDEARAMLRRLSGSHHEVYTGVHLCSDYVELSFSDRTLVDMYELTDEEIENYIKTGEYARHAGGYDPTGKGALLIERINGDYNNLLGLPVGLLLRQMRACGFRV